MPEVPLSALMLVVFIGAAWVYDAVRDGPDELEILKEKRAAEEISQDEFERRLDVLLDDEAERIQAAVEPIPGIGDQRSRYIAERYDSLEGLRSASLEELEQLPDVGEQRAQAIKERLSQ